MGKSNDNLSVEEIVAKALAEQEEKFNKKLKQREENEISLGCTVVETSEIVGKPIIDKESGKQKEVDGEPQFYASKYIAKLSFNGGEIDTPINKKKFESLKLNTRYLAKGRLGEVKEFGNTSIKPIFSDFIEI